MAKNKITQIAGWLALVGGAEHILQSLLKTTILGYFGQFSIVIQASAGIATVWYVWKKLLS